MPDDPSTQSDPRIETGSRARELPQEAQIRKRFDKFQDFVDMYRSRISLGGAFVDVDILRPVGSEVYLDFRLKDGYRLMHGLGEVVWVRLKTMSDERPKGMGLRFLSLDEEGRELVLKLLEEQVKSGGAPFEVDRVPEDGSIDPTVVQAMAGPSAEENEAAQKAKTGSREAQQPEAVGAAADTEDGEELPDLPPGVLPPPDEEPDFSAPWGEQLPEIPTELLEESSASGGPSPGASAQSSAPSIPAVEAPESPYAPGSDVHGEEDAQPFQAPAPPEPAQADFAFAPPLDDGDPHLDETDFGASAFASIDDDPVAEVKPLGEATTLQEAQGGDPFSDFDGESVTEVDGTLFQLPSSGPEESVPEAISSAAPPTASVTTSPAISHAIDEPAAPADEVDLGGSEATESLSFDAPTFEGPSFDTSAAETSQPDLGGDDFDGGFDVDFGLGDDTDSQVAPPPDVGDSAGSAWDPDLEVGTDTPEAESGGFEPPASSSPSSSGPLFDDASPQPTPEETAAMDAAMDITHADYAFEPPESELIDGGGAFEAESAGPEAGGGRSHVATPESIAAAALADQMKDDTDFTESGSSAESAWASPGTSSAMQSASSTDTADDLFAFRGPADAEPALDPEETASLRKGSLLPDLSETAMGTKAPAPLAAEGGDDLHHSYDDWEEWAPQPTKSAGRSKMLIGVILLLLLVGGGSYFFRSTLLPMVGFGGGSDSAAEGPAGSVQSAEAQGDAGVEAYTPPDDPLAEPVEVAQPDSDGGPDGRLGGNDSVAETNDGEDVGSEFGAGQSETEPQTTATADSLRPQSTGRDPPPTQTSQQSSPAPSPPQDGGRSTGRAARHVVGIDVRPGAGLTEVVIRLDGDIRADQFSHDTLSWAPDKEMVTLLGFENFEQTQIVGRGSHLRQVRVGFHPGKELRLVFDLASTAVSIERIQADGNHLVVRLSG